MTHVAEPPIDSSGVKTLHKALSILDVVAAAEQPLSVAEIAATMGIARPTAHRMVQTLISTDYLTQDPVTGRIAVGLSVLQLAGSVLDRNRLRLEALPHLQSLSQRTGMRSNLGILHRDRLLYLAGVEKPSLPMVYSRFGKHAPIHCCSLAKAILATLPAEEVEALFENKVLDPITPNSITSFDRFREELASIRKQGYAVDREEHYLGSFCVAVAIFDGRNRPIGAIGLSDRTPDLLMLEVDNIRLTAELISHRM